MREWWWDRLSNLISGFLSGVGVQGLIPTLDSHITPGLDAETTWDARYQIRLFLTLFLALIHPHRMKASSSVTTSEAHPQTHSSGEESELERVKQVALGQELERRMGFCG